MIATTTTSFSCLLSDYLKRTFQLNEEIITVAPILSPEKSSASNKVHVFLTNIERETAGGIKFNQQKSGDYSKNSGPSLQLNLYVMIAAVFDEKQYEESLSVISRVAMFLQCNNSFLLPRSGMSVSVELVNLTFNELSNLWSISGNMYYPSLLCKLRTLNISGQEIQHVGRTIKQKDVGVDRANKT